MIGLFSLFLALVAAPFKSKSRLEAENAVLRHQLIVLRRKVQSRVQLTNNDRWFLIQLYRWFPSILQPAARRAVEHPFGNFKAAGLHLRRLSAPKCPRASPGHHFVHEHPKAKPWMPG